MPSRAPNAFQVQGVDRQGPVIPRRISEGGNPALASYDGKFIVDS